MLTNFNRATGQSSFNIQGQTDRRYQVQAATNLGQWLDLSVVLATNDLTPYQDPAAFNRRFYRAITQP